MLLFASAGRYIVQGLASGAVKSHPVQFAYQQVDFPLGVVEGEGGAYGGCQ